MNFYEKARWFIAAVVVSFLIFFFLVPNGVRGSDNDYVYIVVQCRESDRTIVLEAGNFDQNLAALNDFARFNGKNCADETEIIVPLSKEYDFKRIHFYLGGKLKLGDEKYNYRHLTYFWKIFELFKKEGWVTGQGKYIGDIKLSHEFLPSHNDLAARARVEIFRKPVCARTLYEEQIGTKSFCPNVIQDTLECINSR